MAVTITMNEPAAPPHALLHRLPWVKDAAAIVVSAIVAGAIWYGAAELPRDARLTLIVTALAIVGWTMTRLGDTQVALMAAASLVVTGVLDEDDFYETLGHELIWLMLAAFVMAAVLKASGLVERATFALARLAGTVHRLFFTLAAAIGLTAFFIPSTSGRAALLLPVFLTVAAQLRAPVYVRALALLFPTVILLSASGSLIGAGAHLIAVEALDEKLDRHIGYLDWMALNAPFAILASLLATGILLRMFLSPELRRRSYAPKTPVTSTYSPRQAAIGVILVLTVAGWMSESWHGIDIGIVAVVGAVAMLQAAGPLLKTKDAFKSVETELIVFLAATFVIADAMIETKVDRWMAESLFQTLPSGVLVNASLVVTFVAIVSLLAHLVITSRTARASVLIPAIVLPLSAAGHNLETLMLIAVTGTGFCQTLTASAKPVALYANVGIPTYTNAELFKLSAALAPAMLILLIFFGMFVWR